MSDNLKGRTAKELLELYVGVLDELRRQNIVRSSNNPVADYTEDLVIRKLNLERCGNSTKGYDAKKGEVKYQIKGRRLTEQNKSAELSAIRNLDDRLFDVLIAVVYKSDFALDYALQIPWEIVKEKAGFSKHTHASRLTVPRSFSGIKGVIDITNQLLNDD